MNLHLGSLYFIIRINMKQTAKRIIFAGQVQGVGFRFTAFSVANRCQLTGVVRNLADGTVEMIAQGEAEDIGDCVREIENSFDHYIKDIQVEQIPLDPAYRDFRITF